LHKHSYLQRTVNGGHQCLTDTFLVITITLVVVLYSSMLSFQLLLGNRSGNIRLFDVKEMKSFYEATADGSFPR